MEALEKDFSGYLLIKGGTDAPNGNKYLHGPAALVEEDGLGSDFDGEDLVKAAIVSGLKTFERLGGQVDWDHLFAKTHDPKHIIGKCVGIQDNPSGGAPIVTTELFMSKALARSAWEHHEAGGVLGYSLQGIAKARDPENSKRITDLEIHMMTLTPNPKGFEGPRLTAGMPLGAIIKGLNAEIEAGDTAGWESVEEIESVGVLATAVADGLYKGVKPKSRVMSSTENFAKTWDHVTDHKKAAFLLRDGTMVGHPFSGDYHRHHKEVAEYSLERGGMSGSAVKALKNPIHHFCQTTGAIRIHDHQNDDKGIGIEMHRPPTSEQLGTIHNYAAGAPAQITAHPEGERGHQTSTFVSAVKPAHVTAASQKTYGATLTKAIGANRYKDPISLAQRPADIQKSVACSICANGGKRNESTKGALLGVSPKEIPDGHRYITHEGKAYCADHMSGSTAFGSFEPHEKYGLPDQSFKMKVKKETFKALMAGSGIVQAGESSGAALRTQDLLGWPKPRRSPKTCGCKKSSGSETPCRCKGSNKRRPTARQPETLNKALVLELTRCGSSIPEAISRQITRSLSRI